MFCTSCGANIEGDTKFCPNCGAPIDAAASAPAPEPAASEPVTEEVPRVEAETVQPGGATQQQAYTAPNNYSNAGYSTNYAGTTSQGSESTGLAIGALVCGILSIVCCCLGWLALILAIAGVAMGIVVLVKAMGGRGMAIGGIVCGGIGLLLAIIMLATSAAAGSAVNMLEDIPGVGDQLEDIMDDMDL